MEMFSTERPLIILALECGCTHKLLKYMCMYVCMHVGYNLCEPPTLLLVTMLEHSSTYSSCTFVSPTQSSTELLNCGNVTGYYKLNKHSNAHAVCWNTFLLDASAAPCLPAVALAPNGDSVKLKSQLCMNQNNNLPRFPLPSFLDTLCDSFVVEGSTRENPCSLISSPGMPTCRGVTPGCPDSVFQ